MQKREVSFWSILYLRPGRVLLLHRERLRSSDVKVLSAWRTKGLWDRQRDVRLGLRSQADGMQTTSDLVEEIQRSLWRL